MFWCFYLFIFFLGGGGHDLNKCLWPSKTVFETEDYLKNAKERLTYLATLTVMIQNCSVSICLYFREAWHGSNAETKTDAGIYFGYQCTVSA